jgi:hypothetical protein
VFTRFEVPAQPALVIVDTDGSVERILGAVEPAELDELLGAATAG